MKNQIKRALELAKSYRDYGIELNFVDGWNYVRGDYNALFFSDNEVELKVYFADDKETCSVELGGIHVCMWTNKIEFPIDITTEAFKAILDDAETFLCDEMAKHKAVVISEVRQQREKEIKELEERVERMKKLN